MTIRAVLIFGKSLALLALAACQEQPHPIGDDFSRALSSQPPAQSRGVASKPRPRTQSTPVVPAQPVAPEPSSAPADPEAAANSEPPSAPASAEVPASALTLTRANVPTIQLAGKSENEIRALLGSPTEEEARPPGKRWRYRDGQCTLDIQLYPDIKTAEFKTLAYEMKNNNYTDEGRRLCLAQLESRVQVPR